jgi:hypothetical protein|tara:strand:- start:167 stop:373 length:207 start_codon:yes stop_codon:yes gene_type:complete
MSRLGDFLIDVKSDSEFVISTCSSFEQFCQKMKDINDMYLPSALSDIWEEYVGSMEGNDVNFHDRRPR